MANKAHDHLHRLIRSMTKAEKRYFKVHSGRHLSDGERRYHRLFDAIAAAEEYDEAAIIQRFSQEAFTHRFAITKRRLYETVLDSLEASTQLRDKLEDNTRFWRAGLQAAGFDIKPGTHPIVPVMVYDAVKAQQLSARLLELGVYAVGFFFPVVPKEQARIRTQMSAALERHHLEKALAAFTQAGRELGLIKA